MNNVGEFKIIHPPTTGYSKYAKIHLLGVNFIGSALHPVAS